MQNLKFIAISLSLTVLSLGCTIEPSEDQWESLGTANVSSQHFVAYIEVATSQHFSKIRLVAKRCPINLKNITVVCTDGFTQQFISKASLQEGDHSESLTLNIGGRLIETVSLSGYDFRNTPSECSTGLVELKGLPE